MARLTAGLVWAAVLRFVVLGVGLSRGSEDLLGSFTSLSPGAKPVKIFCKENPNLNVAIRGNEVVLAQANPEDESQQWVQDYSRVTDDQGHKAFALVNKAKRQVMVNKNIPRPEDGLVQVQLAPYNDDSGVEVSMLWTEGDDLGGGFCEVRTLRDASRTLNGLFGGVHVGTVVGIYPSEPSSFNAIWKITPIY